MYVVRVIAWFGGEPFGERQRKQGHCARLPPHSLLRLSHRGALVQAT